MNKLAILALATSAITPAFAATDIGVSISINQPGVYGRVFLGDAPPPPVVYAQPIIITPTPYATQRQPVYLYVPVEYQTHWSRYCGRYAACGQPVYFVQERWVEERWEHAHPGWQRGHAKHGVPPGHAKEHGHGHGKGHGHD